MNPKPLEDILASMAQSSMVPADGDKAILSAAAKIVADGDRLITSRRPAVILCSGPGTNPVVEALAGLVQDMEVMEEEARTFKSALEWFGLTVNADHEVARADATTVQVTRIVVDHWREHIVHQGQEEMVVRTVVAHVLAMVGVALMGVTNPDELGVTGPDAERIRALVS